MVNNTRSDEYSDSTISRCIPTTICVVNKGITIGIGLQDHVRRHCSVYSDKSPGIDGYELAQKTETAEFRHAGLSVSVSLSRLP